MRFIFTVPLVLLTVLTTLAYAGPLDNCTEYTQMGIPAERGTLLCRKGYALAHNAKYKTPEWVAEHLTKEKASAYLPRKDYFTADPDLPFGGELSANPFNPDSTSNPYGAGSPFKPDALNNPFSPYGSPFSNQSATNPFATDAPRLYDQAWNYRGKLSTNAYDPDSTSNPYGRYGSPYSPDSINNPFGAGNPYSPSSPTNPYGRGLRIEGR